MKQLTFELAYLFIFLYLVALATINRVITYCSSVVTIDLSTPRAHGYFAQQL